MATIILVEPQMGENIGAAARVMHNFGFDDLRIVNPRDGWPNEKAVEMSAGAKALVATAKIYNSLAEAMEFVGFSFAVTARRRDLAKDVYVLDSVCDELSVEKKQKVQNCGAFVFGAERSGLSNENVSFCDAILTVDVNPEYPSLNLAQTVGLVCHRFFVAEDGAKKEQAIDFLDKKAMSQFVDFLHESLEQRDFYSVKDKQKAMEINLRAMFMRMDLTQQELQSLWGVVKCLVRDKGD